MHPNVHISIFTIAKTWKQPKCPLTDEWIKKMQYICTMEYDKSIKKNEIMPFAVTWMDLEMIIQSEVRQTDKEKYDITYMWNPTPPKLMIHMNLSTKRKQTHRHRKQTYGYQSGK